MASKSKSALSNGFSSIAGGVGSQLLSRGIEAGSETISTGFEALRGGVGNLMGGESFAGGAPQELAGGIGGMMGQSMGGALGGALGGLSGIAAGWGVPTSFLEQAEAQTGQVLDGLSGTASTMASTWASTAEEIGTAGLGTATSLASSAGGLLPW